mgnify:CR=1 FL=1
MLVFVFLDVHDHGHVIAALAHLVCTTLGGGQHPLDRTGAVDIDRLHHQAAHIAAREVNRHL